MKSIQPVAPLKTALLIDAVGSAGTAIVQLLAPSALARLLGLSPALLFETGVFMAVYVAALILLARSARVWRALVGLVIVGNLAWAAACIALALLGPAAITGTGVAYLLLQAIAVTVFAVLQYRGLRASPPAAETGPLATR